MTEWPGLAILLGVIIVTRITANIGEHYALNMLAKEDLVMKARLEQKRFDRKVK